MRYRTKIKTAAPVSAEKQARRLIEQATKQPGVAELVKVYEAWQRFDQVFQTHNRLIAPKQIISTSSSSGPVLRHVE